MKGCPLRCVWCHNPEGIAPRPELLFNAKSCASCGNCRTVCRFLSDGEGTCRVCGRCADLCPTRARRLCGKRFTVGELTAELLRSADVFRTSPGGVTFSGGEPLLQADFCAAVAERLHAKGITTAVETSGFAARDAYQKLIGAVDLVFQDLKHPFDAEHRRWTGVSNRPILANLAWLKTSGKPFVVRIPLVPTVNDSAETLEAFAALLENAPNLLRVELLPYQSGGAAKYHLLGIEPPQVFPERPIPPEALLPFQNRQIPCRVL